MNGRLKIATWIEHLLTFFETGIPGDDQLTKLVAFIRAYEAGQRTDVQLAAVHAAIFSKWFILSETNPVGMSVKADLAYAAELATRPSVTAEMTRNVAIALAGGYCKAKSTLAEQVGADGTKSVTGWNHTHFLVEWAWQQAQ